MKYTLSSDFRYKVSPSVVVRQNKDTIKKRLKKFWFYLRIRSTELNFQKHGECYCK